MEDSERGKPEQTGYPEPRTLEILYLLTIVHSARRHMMEGRCLLRSTESKETTSQRIRPCALTRAKLFIMFYNV